MAAATNALFFNVLEFRFDTSISVSLFNYMSLVVVWLVTERPSYALGIHDTQIEEIENILCAVSGLLAVETKRKKEEEEKRVKLIDDAYDILVYICKVLNTCEDTELLQPIVHTKEGKKILVRFRVFCMRRNIGLPNSLHGLTIGVVIEFHGILTPLLLHEAVGWYSLIPNFLLSIYTTGCLDVALKLLDPYSDVKTPTTHGAVAYFQDTIDVFRAVFCERVKSVRLKGSPELKWRNFSNDVVSVGVREKDTEYANGAI